MTTTPIAPSATQTQYPDEIGRFGKYGGKYVPETLMPALSELETAYHRYKNAPEFQAESVSYTHLTLPTIYSV